MRRHVRLRMSDCATCNHRQIATARRSRSREARMRAELALTWGRNCCKTRPPADTILLVRVEYFKTTRDPLAAMPPPPLLWPQLATSSPGVANHSFSLREADLLRGVQTMGRSSAFLAKLQAGEPVSIGVLGASVAENGGCFTQPHKRCMSMNGRAPVALAWGTPHHRPFKGFLVRWFEWLNSTWPNRRHVLKNGGRDANSLVTIAPCLSSHLPASVDVVILEVGSMFVTNTPATIEIILRQLASRRRPPLVIFVTIHLWCTFGGGKNKKTLSYGLTSLPNRQYYYFDPPPGQLTSQPTSQVEGCFKRTHAQGGPCKSASAELEAALPALCERYGAACLSQYSALLPGWLEGRTGFSPREIAGDCLHPVHGSLGTEYVTDLLIFWHQQAVMLARPPSGSGGSGSGGSGGGGLASTRSGVRHAAPGHRALPEPIYPSNVAAAAGRSAACYTLGHAALKGDDAAQVGDGDDGPRSEDRNVLLSWRSTHCAANHSLGHPNAPASTQLSRERTKPAPSDPLLPPRTNGECNHLLSAYSPGTACSKRGDDVT